MASLFRMGEVNGSHDFPRTGRVSGVWSALRRCDEASNMGHINCGQGLYNSVIYLVCRLNIVKKTTHCAEIHVGFV